MAETEILLTLALLTSLASSKTVEYHLTIAEEEMNITGKMVKGITIVGADGQPVQPAKDSLGAVFYVIMDIIVHWGVLRHLRAHSFRFCKRIPNNRSSL